MSGFADYITFSIPPPPKFFIEWAPNPDPLYHSPSESPLEMPIYPPLPSGGIPVDGYMISLDHLIGGRAKRKFRLAAEKHGLHNVLKFSGPIILDSGGYQNAHRDPVKVLEIQSIFRPDFVIHMDVVGDSKRTIRNARITREHENCFSFTIYYAIQGQNIIEYKKCAEKLLKIGCKRFALGNLAYQAYLRRLKEIMEVIFAVKKVTRNNPIHLLGVSNPKLILQLKNLITSFDSSTGVRNATRLREVFAFDGNQIKYFRKFNNRPGEFHCDCPICKIFDIFENEYNYPKGTGDRRKIRFSRAIHNTYIIWKVVNMKNETNT